MRPALLVATLSLLAGPGCSDSGGSPQDTRPPPDGPPLDRASDTRPPDGAPPDRGRDGTPSMQEQEPNDGKTNTEYNTITRPVLVQGAIGKADDIDLFGISAGAGDSLQLSVKSGGTLQAHLAVFDLANKLPAAVNAGPGLDGYVEYYVLQAATILVGIRDRRNVGASQHVGGPAFTYTLKVEPLQRQPQSIGVGSQQSGTLTPPGALRVFAFTAQAGASLELAVLAKALSPPSDVDSRLSLFHVGQKAWAGTNDDPSLGVSDSLLKGAMPYAGTYHAVVENVAKTSGSNLGFALKIAQR